MGKHILTIEFIQMKVWLFQWLIATGIFAFLGIVLCIVGSAMGTKSGNTPYEKRVNRSVGVTTATLATVCMWLIYTSAYFHQVYPMVYPDFEDPDKQTGGL